MWPKTRRTALHIAARFGFHECIKELIVNGADIERKDKDGKTPLELAAWKNHCQTIQELVRLGAKKYPMDYDLLKKVHSCSKGSYYSTFISYFSMISDIDKNTNIIKFLQKKVTKISQRT